MKIEITSKKTNPLLEREEIEFKVKDVNATPKIQELRTKIASLIEANSETTVIREISQKFGRKEIKGKAACYKQKEKMKEIELEYVLGRNFPEEKERIKKAKEEKKALKEKKKLEGKKKKK
jgi:small subunit ribosomal protein S24e